ncbi:CotH kinase family protein [Haliangium sp.]|uniref:CotH kinase family protein n=1 Tax=Haliangium sp. TaxID=2663208 RepID=UPI003D0EDB6F
MQETAEPTMPIEVAANEPLPPDAEGCPGIFSQDILPSFELTIDPAVMAVLYEDWVLGIERNALDEDDTPYRALAEFRYGDIAIKDAWIRLRGNPRFWLEQNKMQFQVAFDRSNPDGRFMGLRKVLFDAATFNRHFYRDRLSLYMLRRADDVLATDIPTPCANNARVYINGEYYGLFTSLEKVDDVFLRRALPDDPDGDLWKRSRWELKTNLDTATDDRLQALVAAAESGDLITMEQYMDVGQMLSVAAMDAMIPNSDGFWAGGLNFYLYDDPSRGKFIVIPWDLDNSFARLDSKVDPISFKKDVRFHGRPFYDTALADSNWYQFYVDTIDQLVNEVYVHDDMWTLIGTDVSADDIVNPTEAELSVLGSWTRQIREAAVADVNKPYTNELMESRRANVARFINEREVFVRDVWLPCVRSGGSVDANDQCQPGGTPQP